MNKLFRTVQEYCGDPDIINNKYIIWYNIKTIGLYPSIFDRIVIDKQKHNIYTYTKYFITKKEFNNMNPLNNNIKHDHINNYLIIGSNSFNKNIKLLALVININNVNNFKLLYVKIIKNLLTNYNNINTKYIRDRRVRFYTFLNVKNSTETFNPHGISCYCCDNNMTEFEKNVHETNIEHMIDNPDQINTYDQSNLLGNDYNIHQGSQLAQTNRLNSLYYYNGDDKIYSNDNKILSFSNRRLKSQEHFNNVSDINKIYDNNNVDIRHTLGNVDIHQDYESKISTGRKYFGSKTENRDYPKISKFL